MSHTKQPQIYIFCLSHQNKVFSVGSACNSHTPISDCRYEVRVSDCAYIIDQTVQTGWNHLGLVLHCPECGISVYLNGEYTGSSSIKYSPGPYPAGAGDLLLGVLQVNGGYNSIELDELLLFNVNVSADAVAHHFSR